MTNQGGLLTYYRRATKGLPGDCDRDLAAQAREAREDVLDVRGRGRAPRQRRRARRGRGGRPRHRREPTFAPTLRITSSSKSRKITKYDLINYETLLLIFRCIETNLARKVSFANIVRVLHNDLERNFQTHQSIN